MKKSNYLFAVSMVLTILLLLILSKFNYLLIHIIIEFAVAAIGIMIFTISLNTKQFSEDNLLILMGPGFLATSAVGILHIISYSDMDIPGFIGTNIAIQLWIILSYILAIAFLTATFNYSKKIKYNLLIVLNFAVAIMLSALIFYGNFPVCYIEGLGLTLFKKVNEYIIIAIYILSLFRISKLYKIKKFTEYEYSKLKIIIILLICGESLFTLYYNAYGIMNLFGHFLKFMAFVIMSDSLLSDLIINPYKKASYNNTHDYLTGLVNRKHFDKLLPYFNKKENMSLGILIIDVVSLKLVNDAYGAKTGDSILKTVAKLLSECTHEKNLLARYGGDEFIVIFTKCSENDIKSFIINYKKKLENLKVQNITIAISSGYSIKTLEKESIDTFLTKAEDDMNKSKLINRIGIRANAVNAILKTLHEKNPREESHSKRVSEISYMFGEKLGLSDREKNMLRMMGLLHDVGKIALDEKILNKTGKLTNEEFEAVKKHPEIGYRILSSSNNISELAEFVLSHHERWDGNGYPRGLRGKEIPYLSRILTIVDSYDAMTSNRTYRDKMKKEEVILEFKKCSGTQFDPELIPIFLVFLNENNET